MNFLENILCFFPRSFTLVFGRMLGKCGYYFFRKRRLLALQNLQAALGNHYNTSQQKIIIQQLFEHLGMNLIEFLRLSEITASNFSQFVTFHGKTYLEEAYTKRQGILVLTAHIGNWELLTAVVSLAGFNTAVIVKAARQKWVEDYLLKVRNQKNIISLFGKHVMKDILRQLKSGGLVGIVLDQHAGSRDGVSVSFFGRQASTFKSLAILSQHTKAVILPIYIYRDKQYHHHVMIEPPIMHQDNENIIARTQRYTTWLESVIRKYPEQWIWTHNRWKMN